MGLSTSKIRARRGRKWGWEEHQSIFSLIINEVASEPFEYGNIDCCRFVSEFVRRAYGIDFSEGFEYNSKEEAYEIIEKHKDLVGLFTHILGEQQPPKMWDPVIVDLPETGQTAGILTAIGPVVKTEKGAIAVSNKFIIGTWTVCPKH